MRHINALLNPTQSTNLEIVLQDALMRANDNILSHPLEAKEIEELQELL